MGNQLCCLLNRSRGTRLLIFNVCSGQRYFVGYGGSENEAAVARVVIYGRVQQALI